VVSLFAYQTQALEFKGQRYCVVFSLGLLGLVWVLQMNSKQVLEFKWQRD